MNFPKFSYLLALIVFTAISYESVNAQLSIKSGGQELEFTEKPDSLMQKIDSVQLTIKSGVNTNSARKSGDFAKMDLILVRAGSVVEILISYVGSQPPFEVRVERMTYGSGNKYRLLKTLSKTQVEELFLNNSVLLVDKYPEGGQQDNYYRVVYETQNHVQKMTSAVKL